MPGERFYSALVPQGGEAMERLDFSAEAWEGPPEHCIGWWRAQLPDSGSTKVYWAPSEVLIAYFDHLVDARNEALSYVMSLVLIRKRIVQWIEAETNADGTQMLHLRCTRNNREYQVEVFDIAADQISHIERQLLANLFLDYAPQPLDSTESGDPSAMEGE